MVANQDLQYWAGSPWAGQQSRDFSHKHVGEAPLDHRPASLATSSMHHPHVPHVLKYNITPIAGGVMLRIWEPASKDDVRVKPFLFMLKYRMTSEAEARKFLEDYLALYKATSLQTSHGYKKFKSDE